MHRQLVAAAVAMLFLAGCSGSSGGASGTASPTASPAHTALPPSAKPQITFSFNDVAVSTGGSNTLRLGFDITNSSDDPLLCDPSEFNVQLSDGSVIGADASADDNCDPNSVDPHSSGKGVMYFDLPHTYTGQVTMFIVINDAVVGQGSTTLK